MTDEDDRPGEDEGRPDAEAAQAEAPPDEPASAEAPPPDAEAPPPTPAQYVAPQPPPAPAPDPEPPRQIWDPTSRRWVTEQELAAQHQAAQQQAAAAAAPGGILAAPAAPVPRAGVPGSIAALMGGVIGAVLAVVAMLFVPGVVDRAPQLDGPSRDLGERSGSAVAPPSNSAELVSRARKWVVGVAVSGSQESVLGPRTFTRSGSGIVLGDEGAIVTPARLVEGADTIKVTLAEGRILDAKLVGLDALTDVAVLDVDATGLPTAEQTSADTLALGDPVVAVSAPTGVQTVVTTGSLSGTGRAVAPEGGELLLDTLQIDAPLATGGSGGALVGPNGELVGMAASFGDNTGNLGYAVPIDIVRSVAQQLATGTGKPAHPWVGLVAEQIETADGPALVVTSVFRGGPAEKADLKPGDAILAIDGAEPDGPLSLLKRVLGRKAGDELRLTLRRAERDEGVTVTVEDRPSLRNQ